jgi:hypothetical protein
LAMLGGATTDRLAEAVPPVPPSVEVTAPEVLSLVPAEVPVTLTENVQLELAARVAPDRLTEPEPATAVIVPAPHDPVSPLGVLTTRPVGRASVKATPVRAVVALLFWTVKVNEVEPPSGIDAAPKALMITGGATTVMVAVAVLPVPLLAEMLTELFFTPAEVPVTLTTTVQLPLAAMVPPDRPTVPDPAAAVAVPLQVDVSPLDVATRSPAGRESEKVTPVMAVVPGLVMFNVREVVPLSGMVGAPKALAMVGGGRTARLADAVFPVPALVADTAPVVLV